MNLFYLKRYQRAFAVFGFVVGVVLVSGSKAHSQTQRPPGERPRRTIIYVGGSPANPTPAATRPSDTTAPAPSGTSGATTTAPTGGQTTPTPAQQCPPGNTTCYSTGWNRQHNLNLGYGTAPQNNGIRLGYSLRDPSTNINAGLQADTTQPNRAPIALDAQVQHIHAPPNRRDLVNVGLVGQGDIRWQPATGTFDLRGLAGVSLLDVFRVAQRVTTANGSQDPSQAATDAAFGRDFIRVTAIAAFDGRYSRNLTPEQREAARVSMVGCLQLNALLTTNIVTFQAHVLSCVGPTLTNMAGMTNHWRASIEGEIRASFHRRVGLFARGAIELPVTNEGTEARDVGQRVFTAGMTFTLDNAPAPPIQEVLPDSGSAAQQPPAPVTVPSGTPSNPLYF